MSQLFLRPVHGNATQYQKANDAGQQRTQQNPQKIIDEQIDTGFLEGQRAHEQTHRETDAAQYSHTDTLNAAFSSAAADAPYVQDSDSACDQSGVYRGDSCSLQWEHVVAFRWFP